MNRKFMIPALALVIALLSGCAVISGGDGADGTPLFGRNIFYTRAASDEEAFSHLTAEEDEEIVLDDESVPLSGLPEEEREEGWLLVRYAAAEDGEVEPMWFHVWSGESWSEETGVCEGDLWTLPGTVSGK